ncbi:MAG: diacylglycerol kinase [Chitinophagaceae bacterium]
MKKNNSFLEAILNAFSGMKYFFLNEINGIIQLAVATVIIALSVGLKVNTFEWIVVLVCIGFVMGLEMLNTAIENLSNLVQKEYHPTIKIVKDVAAAAVLLAATVSILIGSIIFLPKIF